MYLSKFYENHLKIYIISEENFCKSTGYNKYIEEYKMKVTTNLEF